MQRQYIESQSIKHSPRMTQARANIQATLDKHSAFWECEKLNDNAYSPASHRVRADNTDSEQQLSQMLITPRQVEGLEIIQKLSIYMLRATQQINTTIINYELNLAQLSSFEIGKLLADIDQLVINAKLAASKLNINAVQPKVKLDFVNKVLHPNTGA